MKKVLIAMNNETLLNQIKKCGKYSVYTYDIDNKENVIEYLAKYEADVLVTKDELAGNLTGRQYVKEIKKVNPRLKVIMCTQKLDEEYRGFLLANNVCNIIEGSEIKFSKITEMVDSKQGIVQYSTQNVIKKVDVKKDISIMTKQKICIFGTSGAGNSYISSLLAQIMSKKIGLNTLLVDMDIQNAAIDIYNNLTNSTNSLQYLMEEIDRETFNSDILQDLTCKAPKNGKLSFITNNMGIYECQNKLSDSYYSKLYDEAETNYDILILDLPATPFLDVVPFSLSQADKIFFVINPNFISVRQAIKYLDLITNIWKISKEKIYIVVNKTTKESLSNNQITSILRQYNIVMTVKNNSKVEKIINGMDEICLDSADDVDSICKMFGVDKGTNHDLLKNILCGGKCGN